MNRVLVDACTDTELIATPRAFRFGLRLLGNLVKKETEYFCPACDRRLVKGHGRSPGAIRNPGGTRRGRRHSNR